MRIYRGEFVDTGTDSNNVNTQAIIRVDIEDQSSNPYHVTVTQVTVGPNIDFTFTFDDLPSDATSTAIGYSSDGGVNWSSNTGGVISPRTITLPYSAYEFQFVVHRPGGNEFINLADEIIDLETADSPCTISVIDNNEDKFTPIRAKQAQINIHSSSTIDISTFGNGGDDQYKVNIYSDSVLIFTGFLSISDLQQEFLPHPNIITLTATDGLGFLADIPLTDFLSVTPTNEWSILYFLAWALYKTGLRLNIAAIFNIREETAVELINDTDGSGHFFKFCYLDAKTFESNVGECEDCLSVIEKILGKEAFIFQHLGEWKIVRVDEMDFNIDHYVTRWNFSGAFISNTTEVNEQSVGLNESSSWMNDDAVGGLIRPNKEVRLDFKYNLPKEIPCNPDFDRGDFIADLPDETLDGETVTVKSYELDCWELKEGAPGFYGTVDGTTATIHKKFNANDYEKERHIVLTARSSFESSSINQITYIESSPIPVQVKDKFTGSIQWRLDQDIATGGNGSTRLFRFVLHGSDGSWWILGETVTGNGIFKWYNTLLWTVFSAKGVVSVDFDDDMTQWTSIDWTAPPVPVSGDLYIWLNQFNQLNSADDNREVWYSSLSFDYIPYINGSYRKYTGHRHLVASTTDTRNILEDEVFISDSPKKLFKGALLIDNGTDYVITDKFYNAATEQSGPINVKPFGEIQVFDVWNQYFRPMARLEGTVDKCSPLPDLLFKYSLTDTHSLTTQRFFILLHYELNLHLCEWDAYFVEVVSSQINKEYEGHQFKYLTE